MKILPNIHSESVSNMLLYGSILMASIDYIGLLDYILKAFAGGGVWFAFKLLQDHYSPRVKHRAEEKVKEIKKQKKVTSKK